MRRRRRRRRRRRHSRNAEFKSVKPCVEPNTRRVNGDGPPPFFRSPPSGVRGTLSAPGHDSPQTRVGHGSRAPESSNSFARNAFASRPITFVHSLYRPITFVHSIDRPITFVHSLDRPFTFVHSLDRPITFVHSLDRPITFVHSLDLSSGRSTAVCARGSMYIYIQSAITVCI